MKSEYTKLIGTERVSLALNKIGESEYEIIRNIPEKYSGSEVEEELLDELTKDADNEGVILQVYLKSSKLIRNRGKNE